MFSSNASQVSTAANYIEDVFSTWLYTGNGSTGQTIANGIDLSTNGGMVWAKSRSNAQTGFIFDTSRGSGKYLIPSATNASANGTPNGVTFLTNGFSTVDGIAPTFANLCNQSGYTYASWTFAKQPKFFDVVTYTGNGTNPRNISHNLGSDPGCIIVKRTDIGANWSVYHRSSAASGFTAAQCYMYLNSTNAVTDNSTFWSDTAPTSTTFTVGSQSNANGGTYVAYLFAHNAGGFGLTGSDNVISCGSYTGDGTTDGSKLVSLGYEPQWVLVKRTDSSTNGGWHMIDMMRGMPTATNSSSITALLLANTSAAENLDSTGGPSATGFNPVASLTNTNAATYIYIAIRRGPMKVPTDGTKVFAPVVSSVSDGTQITAGFPVDMQIFKYRAGSAPSYVVDRLRGVGTTTTVVGGPQLRTSITAAETNTGGIARNWNNTGFAMPSGFGTVSDIFWSFGRAPSFFDEVCYTGNGVAGRQITHNLAAVPELMIVKPRSTVGAWSVYNSFNGASSQMYLNLTNSADSGNPVWYNTSPTASVFSVNDTGWGVNDTSQTYVAYLFASCLGVSKVGSYTGNGTTQTIDCGFAGGARFVLIKRTDSTGDWYVYDTARGMTTLTDPYLRLNNSAAETATLGSVTTVSTGFALNSAILADINVNGGSYIFLAIA